MSSDMQLKKHVEDELSWEPGVNAAAIGVAVKDAVVTLTGHVPGFAEKRTAEQAVLRIHGVRALANELEVRFLAGSEQTDEDIALKAASALLWHSSIPKDHIKLQVSNGFITLEGTVDWQYQREAAESAVENLLGVKGVYNTVTVQPSHMRAEVRSEIEAALKRNAEIDARHISVSVLGNRVILSGETDSFLKKITAERAAWKAPGVIWVENNIQVSPVSGVVTAA
jgi:osmotically-inducible protein OsmY